MSIVVRTQAELDAALAKAAGGSWNVIEVRSEPGVEVDINGKPVRA